MRRAIGVHDGIHSQNRTRENLQQSVNDANSLGRSLNLPREVRKRASSIASEADGMGFCRFTASPILVAAALYVACREYKVSMTLRELAIGLGTDARDIRRCYNTILERMHISPPALEGRRYVQHLSLRHPVSKKAISISEEIIQKTTSNGIGGRNPMTLAAASLYVACQSIGERITQSELAEAAGVGVVSVRQTSKAIRALI